MGGEPAGERDAQVTAAPGDPPPGAVGGGWRSTAAALAVTETVSWGVLYYAFGVFLAPTGAELGWTTAQISGAFSLALLISGLAAPLAGRWIDRRGPRGIMTAGSAAAAIGVAGWALADGLAAFYAVWALIGLAMAATLYEPAFATAARYPPAERRAALTTITLAAALASTIFWPLSAALLERFGRQGALLALAAALALVTAPLHRLALPAGPTGDADPSGGASAPPAAPPQPGFARIATAFALEKATGVGASAHVVAFLALQGLAPSAAAGVAGIIGIAKIAGRIAVVAALRRGDAAAAAGLVLAAQAGSLVLAIAWPGLAGAISFAAVFGAASGAATILRPELMARRLGTAAFASRSGAAAMVATAAAAGAPAAAGLAVTAAGSYTPAWLGMAAASAAAAAMLAPLRAGRVDATAI